jgi:hypothetical protein
MILHKLGIDVNFYTIFNFYYLYKNISQDLSTNVWEVRDIKAHQLYRLKPFVIF